MGQFLLQALEVSEPASARVTALRGSPHYTVRFSPIFSFPKSHGSLSALFLRSHPPSFVGGRFSPLLAWEPVFRPFEETLSSSDPVYGGFNPDVPSPAASQGHILLPCCGNLTSSNRNAGISLKKTSWM